MNTPWAYIRTKDKFDGSIFGGAYKREGSYSRGETLQFTICKTYDFSFFFPDFLMTSNHKWGGGGVYTRVLIFAMLIGFHIWSGRIFEEFIYGGVLTRFYGIWKNVLIYFILTVLFNLTTIQQKRLKVKLIGHRSKRKIKNNLMNLEFIIWKVLRHSQTTQIKK